MTARGVRSIGVQSGLIAAALFGAVLAIVLGAPVTVPLAIAAALMALGVWLHLTERHEHEHTHNPVTHSHEHYPDAHDRHEL